MKKLLGLLLFCIFLLQGCADKISSLSDDKTLSGIGASFPAPFYSSLISQYKQASGNTIIENRNNTGIGIRSLKDKTIDFAGVTCPLSDMEISGFDSEILSIPVCLGAIVMAYNIPGISELKLTPELIADIYLQKITYWNDPAIRAINPELNLPAMEIIPVLRADESGSNYIFTDYLCKTSPEWEKAMGKGRIVRREFGISANGNILVSSTIKETPGTIGYVEAGHASLLKLSTARLRNASGEFVGATKESIRIAAETDYPDDMRIMITNSPNEGAYPLSCFSWFLVYKNQANAQRSHKKYEVLKDFLMFCINPRLQKAVETMSYVPLPDEVIEKARIQIESIEWAHER